MTTFEKLNKTQTKVKNTLSLVSLNDKQNSGYWNYVHLLVLKLSLMKRKIKDTGQSDSTGDRELCLACC